MWLTDEYVSQKIGPILGLPSVGLNAILNTLYGIRMNEVPSPTMQGYYDAAEFDVKEVAATMYLDTTKVTNPDSNLRIAALYMLASRIYGVMMNASGVSQAVIRQQEEHLKTRGENQVKNPDTPYTFEDGSDLSVAGTTFMDTGW